MKRVLTVRHRSWCDCDRARTAPAVGAPGTAYAAGRIVGARRELASVSIGLLQVVPPVSARRGFSMRRRRSSPSVTPSVFSAGTNEVNSVSKGRNWPPSGSPT